MWDSSSRPSCAHAATALGHSSRCRPWPWAWGSSSRLPPLTSDSGYLLSTAPPRPRTRGSSSRPFLCRRSLVLSVAAPDLGLGVTPLGRRPSGMGSSRLLPLTSDVARPSQPPALWCAHCSRQVCNFSIIFTFAS